MTFKGWRIWYADGTSRDSTTDTWELCPSSNIQMVTFYYEETYQIWKSGYCEHGLSVDGQWREENYCDQLVGKDYYWFVTLTRSIRGAGQLVEVPLGLPDGAVKTGSSLPDAEFRTIYNLAEATRVL